MSKRRARHPNLHICHSDWRDRPAGSAIDSVFGSPGARGRALCFPPPLFFEEFQMKSRAIVALGFGAALVFCSADAQAFGGLFSRHGGCCEPTCCAPEPSCAFEPSCGIAECCDPCAPRCRLLGRLRGLFHRNDCCVDVCEPTCCAPEPTCCAPEPSCCVVEPSCGCFDDCCEPACCAPRCRILEKIGGLFRRGHHCGYDCGCEPSCGFEPSCGCHG